MVKLQVKFVRQKKNSAGQTRNVFSYVSLLRLQLIARPTECYLRTPWLKLPGC